MTLYHFQSLQASKDVSLSSVVIFNGRRSASDSTSPLGYDPNGKYPVGSEEWLKQRRDNHKEVERKRRETINEGINALARIVPNGEKNKGRVISRAVQYINQLKQNEAANLEKWTLEKLLCEQAIQDLHNTITKLKAENAVLKMENAQLKGRGGDFPLLYASQQIQDELRGLEERMEQSKKRAQEDYDEEVKRARARRNEVQEDILDDPEVNAGNRGE
ncbi:basic helix-loop-helix protein [Phlyctochytrium planicorne]|nr:basic helix-loop-helix protein [Phlyctochytrium planicorne]